MLTFMPFWQFFMCFTLCNPTPCLFQHRMSPQVHVRLQVSLYITRLRSDKNEYCPQTQSINVQTVFIKYPLIKSHQFILSPVLGNFPILSFQTIRFFVMVWWSPPLISVHMRLCFVYGLRLRTYHQSVQVSLISKRVRTTNGKIGPVDLSKYENCWKCMKDGRVLI